MMQVVPATLAVVCSLSLTLALMLAWGLLDIRTSAVMKR
jgi:hypothetical protein